MSIKRDYTSSTIRDDYKSRVRRQTLTKIVVENEEKRSRAELLDMVEELFEGQKKQLNFEDLRAMIHMLVKSVANNTDDDTGATSEQVTAINSNTAKNTFPGFGTTSGTALEGDTSLLQLGTTSSTALAGNTTVISSSQASAITANTAKVSQGLATANHTLQFDVTNKKGTYALVVTIIDNSVARPVTKTATINLS